MRFLFYILFFLGLLPSFGASLNQPITDPKVKNFIGKSIGATTNLIEWQAAISPDIKYFVVQKSDDGLKFDSVVSIYVLGDRSADSLFHYSYTDEKASSKLSYYRIKQVSTDGSKAFSKVITVESISSEIDIKVFPDQYGGDVYVHIPGGMEKASTVSVKVLDLFGKVAFESNLDYYQEVMEVSFELAKGFYNLSIEAGELQFSKSLTIR